MKNICLLVIMMVLSQTAVYPQSYLKKKTIRDKKTFAITDFGYSRQFNGYRSVELLTWELGIMKNINSDIALGGSVDFTSNDEIFIKLRVRKWFTDQMSIDVAPGYDINNKAFMVGIEFHPVNWFAITTQVNHYKGFDGNKFNFSAGVKLSSKPGLIAQGITVIGGLIIIAATWDDLY